MWKLQPNELHFPVLVNQQLLGEAVLFFLCTSTNPATPVLLWKSYNFLLNCNFILFVSFITSKLIFNLFPRQLLALGSAAISLQWMQWTLVFDTWRACMGWDIWRNPHSPWIFSPHLGSFSLEVLLSGGGSGIGTLWQVLCCGCHGAGDRWWKVSRIMNNLDLQLALLSAEGTINTARSPLQLLSSSFYPFLSPSLLLPILLSISFFTIEATLCIFPSIN